MRSRIQVWLSEQVNMWIEGCIIGFDEYMNLVLDDAEEIHSKTKSRKQLGVSCVCATRATRGLKPAWAVLVKCLHGILLLSLPVWVPQVSSVYTRPRTFRLLALSCQRAGWGCSRSWEGTDPGQLTQTGQRGIPYHLTSC
ncbi:uncharacterized protein [Anser cygnoides]|uniref:uncharacterized protein isoform X3 n=1 Tax=Anser cygnoides TaxID=8845 RepID=UPI0034D2E4A4